MSSGKPKFFRKVFTGDRNFDTLQTNIEAAVGNFLKIPLLNGRLLESVELSNGNTNIEHKLSREYKGYIIVRKSNGATIYDVAGEADKYVTLNSSAACTVSLWVF